MVFWNEAEKFLRSGGIGILPTDTLYGIVGRAESKEAIARIYQVKQRNLKKPLIVLISSFLDLKKFGIKLGAEEKKRLERFWPGKVSVILPSASRKFSYLHRGRKSLAFRLPKKKRLLELIKKTGPLVAPSANPEGKPPAQTIKEARNYFGRKVDFYVSAGKLKSPASTLIKLKGKRLSVLRSGQYRIKNQN